MKLRAEDSAPTRQSLLLRLKQKDDSAGWKEFFDSYWQLIYNVARKAGLTDAGAQDVVQETVIAVARKIEGFDTDPRRGSFKSWLLGQARWRIGDQFRERKKADLNKGCSQPFLTGQSGSADDSTGRVRLKVGEVNSIRRAIVGWREAREDLRFDRHA